MMIGPILVFQASSRLPVVGLEKFIWLFCCQCDTCRPHLHCNLEVLSRFAILLPDVEMHSSTFIRTMSKFCSACVSMLVFQLSRKILVSVNFLSAILGPEMAAPILWAPGKMRSFLQEKTMSIQFLLLGGGISGLGGGGECRFYFYWARGFFWTLSRQQNLRERRLGVFRMGAPESAQNSECGSIQTPHDFPYLIGEGKWFSCKWSTGSQPEKSSLKLFSQSSECSEVHAGLTSGSKTRILKTPNKEIPFQNALLLSQLGSERGAHQKNIHFSHLGTVPETALWHSLTHATEVGSVARPQGSQIICRCCCSCSRRHRRHCRCSHRRRHAQTRFFSKSRQRLLCQGVALTLFKRPPLLRLVLVGCQGFLCS